MMHAVIGFDQFRASLPREHLHSSPFWPEYQHDACDTLSFLQ